ncbi:MAG: sodium pump decarboxylase gamma subunit [Clostridia bacterium]|nr:sodium pump decarboxylase gamma subunit [Clostridia bacterium]
MGKGMLGIFIVMGIIILCVSGLNALGTRQKKEKKDK